MPKLYNEDNMRALIGGYRIGTVDDLNSEGYLRIARTRRRQLGQMTMALDTVAAKRRIPDSHYQISQKIDGEFSMMIYEHGEVCLLNPGKTLRVGAPFMIEAAEMLKKSGVKKALIGGEFYVQRDQWVTGTGHEGVVARSETAGVFKVKPRHSLDLAVIGFTESTDDRVGMLHDMLLAIVRKDGTYQIVTRVGGGFSDEQRVSILKKLTPMVADSEFHEVNSSRVAYQMVEPGLVVEIECLDLVAMTSRGNPIDKICASAALKRSSLAISTNGKKNIL